MFCANCGEGLNGNQNFCASCGAPNLSLLLPLIPVIEQNHIDNKNKIDASIDMAREVVSDVIKEVKTSEYVNGVAESAQPLTPILRLVAGLAISGVVIYLFFLAVDYFNPPSREINTTSNYSSSLSPNYTNTTAPVNSDREKATGDSLEKACINLAGPDYVNNGFLSLPANVTNWLVNSGYDAERYINRLNSSIGEGGKKRSSAYRSYIKTLQKASLGESNILATETIAVNKPHEEYYKGDYKYKAHITESCAMWDSPRSTKDILDCSKGDLVFVVDNNCYDCLGIYCQVFIHGKSGYVAKSFLQ